MAHGLRAQSGVEWKAGLTGVAFTCDSGKTGCLLTSKWIKKKRQAGNEARLQSKAQIPVILTYFFQGGSPYTASKTSQKSATTWRQATSHSSSQNSGVIAEDGA